MKPDETSSIIQKQENENIPLSEQKGLIVDEIKQKIISNKKIIYISLVIITFTIIITYIFISIKNKKSSKGIEGEDFTLSIYTKEKMPKKQVEFEVITKKKKKKRPQK